MELIYDVQEYTMTKETAVMAYTEDEPFACVSVCLFDYGYTFPKDVIAVPAYQLCGHEKQVIEDIADEVLEEIQFGPFNSKAIIIRLKPEVAALKNTGETYIPERKES